MLHDNTKSAFPVIYDTATGTTWQAEQGMLLLDYFAAKALQGLCAKYNLAKPEDQQILAQLSYELADTMMEERKKHIPQI